MAPNYRRTLGGAKSTLREFITTLIYTFALWIWQKGDNFNYLKDINMHKKELFTMFGQILDQFIRILIEYQPIQMHICSI